MVCDFCAAFGLCHILFEFVFLCFFKPTTAFAACTLIRFAVEFGMVAELLQQSGDNLLSPAERGCNRSGESARRNNGELGSALFGRANDDFFDPATVVIVPDPFGFETHDTLLHDPVPLQIVLLTSDVELLGRTQPGLYDWVVFDEPG